MSGFAVYIIDNGGSYLDSDQLLRIVLVGVLEFLHVALQGLELGSGHIQLSLQCTLLKAQTGAHIRYRRDPTA